jgi:hypothetical protein
VAVGSLELVSISAFYFLLIPFRFVSGIMRVCQRYSIRR